MHSKRLKVGIDVSKATLEACAESPHGERRGEFDNSEDGFRRLIKWMGKKSRVYLEATGAHHLQLCLALRRSGIEVMVINPRVARKFAEACSVRTKTDRVDARVLLEFGQRMEFVPWEAPPAEVLELRDLARRLDDLIQAAADEKKRRHAFVSAGSSPIVLRDVDVHVRHINQRIRLIEKSALAVILAHPWLRERMDALVTITGVGKRTAILLLAELLPLDPSMSVREITAYAGLDPRQEESGSSVRKQPRISRVGNARLRAALFLPAMTLIRSDENARHFRDRLVARGKKKMQAVVAVMRKLLHAVWVILQRRTPFDATKLFPLDAAAIAAMGQRVAMAESADSAMTSNQPEARTCHPKGRSEAEERQLDSSWPEATPPRQKCHIAA